MPHLNSKLPLVGTTIFSQMSALATKHQALNLSQGFPNFACPAQLTEYAAAHMRNGLNQYAPMPGVPALQQQIAELVQQHYGYHCDAEQQITITSGATEALFVAIQAIVQHGDEVIIFDPAYDSYQPAIELAGGKAVAIPLQPPLYQIDWAQVALTVSPRTRAIIINSPHNPTGSVLSAQDIEQLKALVLQHNLWVISDEVYEHIVFDKMTHQSVLRDAELSARSFAISSFGKTFHITGWKIGYCIAPKVLTTEFRKIHQYVTFSSATPLQHAIADFMRLHPEHVTELAGFYQHKRDYFANALSTSRFKLLPCTGTYFQLVDYSAISELDDVAFCQWLTEQQKVAAIPLSVFYQDKQQHRLVRLCFAKDQATLQAAAEALCRI